jgi:hypothetical protein
MLISSKLSWNLLQNAILSTNYIIHKISHKKLNKTLYELYNGQRPFYKYI